MYNLDSLSPEELQQLTDAVNSHSQAIPGDMGGQEQDSVAMLEPFAKVLDVVIDKMEELEDKCQRLEKLVVDDLFGGIQKMYDTNLRTQEVDGLKGKYGDMFSPYEGGLKEFAPDEDVYEVLRDLIEPMKGEDGFNDEMEMGRVQGFADQIRDKLQAISGSPMETEIETTEISMEEPSKEDAFLEKVKKMKENATQKGM